MTTVADPIDTASPDDARAADPTGLLRRLSRQSVDKHFDAYTDVDWDAPGYEVVVDDPRWALTGFDGLGGSEWYRSLSPEQRGTIGLWRLTTAMRTGWEFENLLQRGLLAYVYRLPNGSAEFRYLHHEIIEESQHTLMFQELVNRTGLPVRGMPKWLKVMAEKTVVPLNRRFPALFFLFVLGGEEPADHLQRRQLKDGLAHPLAERIIRIHVTEEARHLSFARHFLKTRVPGLSRFQRLRMAVSAPVLLGIMSRLMVQPSRYLVDQAGIPRDVARAAARSPEGRQLLKDSVAKVRRLCVELGLVTPATTLLWRAMGIWDRPDRGPRD